MYEHLREAPTDGMFTKNMPALLGKPIAFVREAVFGLLDGVPVANLIPKAMREII